MQRYIHGRALQVSGLVLLALVFVLLLSGVASAWNGYSADYNWPGSGTSGDPWVLSTPEQLKGFANRVNTGNAYGGHFFKLGADINLESRAWVPIGGACTFQLDSAEDHDVPTGAHFDGVFDGQNHTISGINVSNPASGTGAYGLFGYTNGGLIANLSLSGSLDMGAKCIDAIGAVVGYCRGSLYNAHSSMTVSMNDSTYSAESCGGIAGVVENLGSGAPLYVRYCSNTGNLTGRGRLGGVVGSVFCVSEGGVVVDQCYNTGDITSTTSTSKIFSGGIVGYCRGFITNCYNWGDLTSSGGHYLAGIAGILTGMTTAPIAWMADCYSTAVFHEYNSGYDRWLWASADRNPRVHITNCFWLPDASNSDITQPGMDDSWGIQTFVSSVTSSQLQGEAELTGTNRSGTFSGHVLDYLGGTDLTNANGSYGFGYASSGTYPVLAWQLAPDFLVDLSGGLPAPVPTYSVAASVSKGQGTVSVNPIMVTGGGSAMVTTNPAEGYWLVGVTDNGTDVSGLVSGNTYAIPSVTGNHTVLVAYSNGSLLLTYAAGVHGYITGVSSQEVMEGSDGSPVTAVAVTGYHFAGWTDGSTENPRTDTDVTADISVKAIFLPNDTATTRPWDHFTIAVLPDTQYYSEKYPAIFDQQAQWIADNAKSENVVFVSHLGDLVDGWNSDSQWKNAHDSMAIIRASGIPYSVVPGNHDLEGDTGDLTYFDTYFPYTDFAGYPWYRDHYPATSNASNYELFTAMGQDFLMLNLVCDSTLLAATTEWANGVLDTYTNRKAIVVTHGYIDATGAYLDADSVSGSAVWNTIVKLHTNVIAVLCGHYAGEYNGTATGDNGNTIYNLLTDYQGEVHGGNGWLRLYEFYPLEDRIAAVTYSPYLGQYQTDADSDFDLTLEQDSYQVTFTSEGATYTNMVAAGGSHLSAPPDPTRDGHTFAGWYADAACTDAFDFATDTITGDLTLYAKWNNSFALTLFSGWNLVAAGSGTTFPATLFGWNGTSYQSTTTPAAWQGYWCKVGSGQTVSMHVVSGPHSTILTTGWNLIGNPMGSTAALTISSGRAAFVYDPVARTYVSTTTLAPGQGAWVKGTAEETVEFGSE